MSRLQTKTVQHTGDQLLKPTDCWQSSTITLCPGLPFTLEGNGRYVARRSPLLGEHTEDILYDVLGLDAAEVNRLMSEKAAGF